MATEAYHTESIRLLNGEEVDVRPLPIFKVRKFMATWRDFVNWQSEKFAELESLQEAILLDVEGAEEAQKKAASLARKKSAKITDEFADKQLSVFVELAAYGLHDLLVKNGLQEEDAIKPSQAALDYLEKALDEQTIQRILKVLGLELGNLQAPME